MKKTTDSPTNVYKKMVSGPCCSSDLQPVLIPRNVKQIHNAQASQRQQFRLSHDALYNLHEMAYDTSGFVRKIETYPDLVVMCAFQSLMDELIKPSLIFPFCYHMIPLLALVIYMYHHYYFAMCYLIPLQ